MNTRRITLALGAATGGMLASAFLSTAVAFADGDAAAAVVTAPAPTDTLTDVAFGPEQITSQDGIPPLFQELSGYQVYDINDTTVGTTANPVTLGSFTTLDSSSSFFGGDTNTELLVTADGTPAANAPTGFTEPGVGSVYDTFNFGNGYENLYSDIVGGTAAAPTHTVTDTFVTPFGDLPLTSLYGSFDASALTPTGAVFGPFEPLATAFTAPDLVTGLDTLVTDLGPALGATPGEIATITADIAAIF